MSSKKLQSLLKVLVTNSQTFSLHGALGVLHHSEFKREFASGGVHSTLVHVELTVGRAHLWPREATVVKAAALAIFGTQRADVAVQALVFGC